MAKTENAAMHDGKVVSVDGDKITTTCSQGKTHCHTVDKDAKVTCDGQAIKATELKSGTEVRITSHKDDKSVATAIECGKQKQTASHKA